jgi:arginyl-tRNA synthetase
LDITVNEFGESFYNHMLPDLNKEMEDRGFAKMSEGALCMFIPKKKVPLMLRKSDGGFNYDTTDMAAAKYRLTQLKAKRLVYLTDVGQFPHFELIFAGAQIAGWHQPGETKMEHMGFGLVSDANGQKFKTRSGETVKLVDLLDEGRKRAKDQLLERFSNTKKDTKTTGADKKEETTATTTTTTDTNQKMEDEQQQKKDKDTKIVEEEKNVDDVEHAHHTYLNEDEIEEAAEKIGMAAIKYFDLRQNRTSDYRFDYNKMLDVKGNTAVYLLYSYARICQIIKKSGLTQEDFKAALDQGKGFKITHPHERFLAMSLIRFPEVLNTVSDELNIHKLCDYIYDISVKVAEGYRKYRIIDSEDKVSRVLLCEAVRKVMLQSFHLVGIKPLDRI